MKNYLVYFLLFSILLLSGCARKVVSPPVEPAPADNKSAKQIPATVVQNENQPIARAEIAHLVNSSLLQKDSRYAKAAFGKKGFITPVEFRNSENPIIPDDVRNNPMLFDIKKILSYNFRGLIVDGNNMFRPDDPLSRAGFALLVEDILALGLGDTGLSRLHIGSNSPFADVNDDYFALNAIISVTTKNIMSADVDKRFRPEDPVTRKEAKEAITLLQQFL